MKKVWIAILAVALIWALVPGVQAEDRLSMGGSMRVIYNYKDADGADSMSYFTQRLRIGGAITPAEGVSANFRFDLSDGTWGMDYGDRTGWNKPSAAKEIDVDRAFLKVDKELWSLWAGHNWHGYGQYMMWDDQTTGINLDIKLKPVTITLHYSKMDESGGTTDEDNVSILSTDVECPGPVCAVSTDTTTEDTDFYGLVLQYAHDAFNVGAMYASVVDNTPSDDSVYGLGIFGDTKFGPVNLAGEVNFFGGECGKTVDYTGTQLALDANMQALDNLLLGAQFWYAKGSNDTSENQATGIINGGETFAPGDWYGPLFDFGYPLGSNDQFWLPGGTDLGQADTGIIGGMFYGSWTIIEPLVAYFNLAYATTEENSEAKGNVVDSAVVLGGTLDYRLAARTSLTVGYLYTDWEYETSNAAYTGNEPSDQSYFLTKLQVNF